jgi:sigma-B regulation protein RsbU (phosphoserine phosphatase)
MNIHDEEWGVENIIREIPRVAAMSAQSLAAYMVQAADAFAAGAPQHDDMTVLVLRAK